MSEPGEMMKVNVQQLLESAEELTLHLCSALAQFREQNRRVSLVDLIVAMRTMRNMHLIRNSKEQWDNLSELEAKIDILTGPPYPIPVPDDLELP